MTPAQATDPPDQPQNADARRRDTLIAVAGTTHGGDDDHYPPVVNLDQDRQRASIISRQNFIPTLRLIPGTSGSQFVKRAWRAVERTARSLLPAVQPAVALFDRSRRVGNKAGQIPI